MGQGEWGIEENLSAAPKTTTREVVNTTFFTLVRRLKEAWCVIVTVVLETRCHFTGCVQGVSTDEPRFPVIDRSPSFWRTGTSLLCRYDLMPLFSWQLQLI